MQSTLLFVRKITHRKKCPICLNHVIFNHAFQYIHAFVDLLQRGHREVESQCVLVAAFGVEMRAGHVRHARVHALLEQRECVHAFGQRDPYEQPAVRTGVPDAFREFRELIQHRIALDAVVRADALDMPFNLAGVHVRVHDFLRQVGGVQVLALFADVVLLDDALVRNRGAHAQPRRYDLGKA